MHDAQTLAHKLSHPFSLAFTLYMTAELNQRCGEAQAAQEQAEDKSEITAPLPPILDPHTEAEGYFLKAIDIARQQQAKSLELRAVMSLVRLRQQQTTQPELRTTHHEAREKLDEAHTMLADIYNWFTEGFDTKDLQEAKLLLDTCAK